MVLKRIQIKISLSKETNSKALYPEVISVGAITKSLNRAYFSSTGNEIDLVAPGFDILSTTNDGEYGSMTGTSMAAPHVTGAIAVNLSEKKKQSVDQVKTIFFETATKVGLPHEYGNGVVHLAKALGHTTQSIEPIESNPSDPGASENLMYMSLMCGYYR